ncbi:MAG: hypothetical protein EOP88_17440 [Verrucomicrobiaceae bacterium]|nr:MAG: hypothetical protein EOP88_17440 [Verrucomicrobiaceae bacterium]
MKTSPRSFSPLVVVAMAGIGWVLVLSLALRVFFDASITGGWLIVGTVFTVAALGLAILVKEFNEAFLMPVCNMAFVRDSSGFPVAMVDEAAFASWEEQLRDLSRRQALGLNKSPRPSANRPRFNHKQRLEPLDFRFAFERVISADPMAA